MPWPHFFQKVSWRSCTFYVYTFYVYTSHYIFLIFFQEKGPFEHLKYRFRSFYNTCAYSFLGICMCSIQHCHFVSMLERKKSIIRLIGFCRLPVLPDHGVKWFRFPTLLESRAAIQYNSFLSIALQQQNAGSKTENREPQTIIPLNMGCWITSIWSKCTIFLFLSIYRFNIYQSIHLPTHLPGQCFSFLMT